MRLAIKRVMTLPKQGLSKKDRGEKFSELKKLYWLNFQRGARRAWKIDFQIL
ncbi:MAG: hypothetical protein CM15mP59_2630 [Flavobacteriaceae bacterium]|nr:MAG: hypothetical protein CM15mP59_2630 [Flavobacteriaceae bacterium]